MAVPVGAQTIEAQAGAGPSLRFWDGSDPALHENGVVDGGSGRWNAHDPSWTDAQGAVNGPMRPVPAFVLFQGAAGTVTIDDSLTAPSITGMQFLTDGYRLTGGRLRLDGGAYTSIRPGPGVTTRIDAELTGDSGLLFNDFGTLILTGDNSYTGGTRVDAGTLIGDTRSIRGELENAGTVIFDQKEDGTFTGGIGGLFSSWGLMVKRGQGALTIGGSSLDWRIEEGRLVSPAARLGGNMAIGAAGKLTLTGGPSDTEAAYHYALSGSGALDLAGEGMVVLTGQSGGFTGQTRVAGAALRVDGALGGSLSVGSHGVLSGAGRVGAARVDSGGRLVGSAGGTLGFSSLTLGPGAVIDAVFAGTDAPPLFAVEGDLTLDGTLNIGGNLPLGQGVYRLFSYGGQLTDNGLQIGALPPGQGSGTLSVQTATPGQVNIVAATGDRALRFWDGGDATRYGNGVVDGGPGVWANGTLGWTGSDGAHNDPAGPGDFAIFAGRGGHVLIDDANGAVSTGGMQFATSGYRLSGDPLTLSGGRRTVIRVGDGSAASSGVTVEIASRITGGGVLVKRDAGTLILSGDNDRTFGIDVEAGSLVGDARSIRGDLSNAGTVIFDQRGNGTFRSDIASLDGVAGSLVKRGAGDLTLTGRSSLDWTVEEGRLLTNAGRFIGDATLHPKGSIEFASASNTRYLGRLAGSGRFVKAGAGNLALGTDSRGFTGDTLVRAGSLTVEGAIRGRLTVAADAALAGYGSMGSVRVDPGGRIAPGPSIRTLTVQGDLLIASGARYEVEVDPTGAASDRIDVLGKATLAGTVAHVGPNGAYRPRATYTILTARGGIEGRFDDVRSTFAFLTPSLGYTPHAVTLTLERNDVRFDQVAATDNQRATAAALESLSSDNGAYDAVVTADAATARQAFDSLSGEFHASLRTALIENSRLSREATLDQLRTRRTAPGLAMWGQVLDSSRHWTGHSGVSTLAGDMMGTLAGVEAQTPGGFRIGMLGGHHRDALHGRGNADIDGYHAGVYAGGASGPLGFGGGLIFGWQDVAAQRLVTFNGFQEGVQSRYRATTMQAFAEAAYRVDFDEGALEPFVGLTHVALSVGSSREAGNVAALDLARDRLRTSYTTMGVRGRTAIPLGGASLSLRASAAWQHAFGDRTGMIEAALGGRRFTITGARIAQDSLVGELSLDAALTPALRLNLGYSGALPRGARDSVARAALTWSF
ncbi:autotransporter outer membrane beta-barrel domain-containing protein [Sphingobium cloacae]|uniref:Autotransporter n=1 Tax=Sphingobium cloacae TaxID=120107 RepID=A0A1E1F3H1_9SPHN|nr:autotransporter domain-containing protein [Sphingobium cloacae]BAV64981.1 autotransporter [Sphingobium cloacae]